MPLDLSQPELRWFTWGFEGTAHFARPVDASAPPRAILVNAQACTSDLCSWIDDLEVPVSTTVSAESFDPGALVDVAPQLDHAP